MKEILSAITLVILIHFMLFKQLDKIILIKKQDFNSNIKKETKETKLTFVNLKKKSIEKKILKKKKSKKEKKYKVKKKIRKKTYKQKEITKKRVKKELVISKNNINKGTTFKKKTLESFLANPINTQNETKELLNDYIHLYGNEFSEFTNIQKAYIKKNLPTIQSITQKYLRYPRIAIKTRQQGMSVIEFFLHPNGDISALKLKSSSGYSSLDKESIDVIKTAYKEYPKPKEKTKMIFYIRFIMH